MQNNLIHAFKQFSLRGRMALESVLNRLPSEQNASIYLSLFGLIIALFLFKLATRSKSNVPPSPPKLPFIGNLHQLGTLPHRTFRDLSHKYGPLMLLHLGRTPTLVVSSSDVLREIVKTHDVVFSNRPQTTAAKIFFYGCKDVGFTPYGEEWRQIRKITVSELLSLNRVRSYQFIREEEVAELLTKLREACVKNDGSSVNLTEMLIVAVNNIVSRCLLGEKYYAPDGSSRFGDVTRKMTSQFVAFSFGNFFPSLGWMDVVTGLIPKLKATFRELDTFFDEVIAKHKTVKRNDVDDHSNKKDFADILLQLQKSGTLDFELTGEHIKAILADMFVGGSDTSSTTLEWAMAELVKNPHIMKKAQEDVGRVVGDKTKVEESDLRKTKYLYYVIKETLRLHPPAPLLVPRETRSSVRVKGYDIPPKTSVFVNAWAIQRDPEVWERPEEFIPERFENSEVDFKGQDFQFIPFGAGRRGCPGIQFGAAVVEYVLANLLYWFDWKLPENCASAEDIDMRETNGITANRKVPLHLKPVPHSFGSKI